MPNRRRRKLSTAMSAVAALAVASPFAVVAITEFAATPAPAPQEHPFVQAAVVTDLPNELMSALSQGLSQFGINLPPLPTGLSPAGAQPVSAGPTLATPGLGTGLTPGLGGTSLTPSAAPALTTPGTAPSLTDPALANPGLTSPGLTTPAVTGATPGLATPPAGVPNPALTAPAAAANPALTAPGATPGLGLPATAPITSPTGLGADPLAGTYPILGDPSGLGSGLGTGLGTSAAPSGGIISDLSSAAQQLGAGQAIDLIKGMVMPSIMSAIQQAAPAAAAAAPAATAAQVVHAAGSAVPLA
ncbi:MAG TPA: hypothetical protein VFW21_13635 [Mycobacterium sp.]|nr:hypothetical protein [Mycobacterium sp.]